MNDLELEKMGDETIQLARECSAHRIKSAKNKLSFDTILSSKINSFYAIKKNLGHETSRLMLLSENIDEVKTYDENYHMHLASYKGKEGIIKALVERINIEKKIRSEI